MDEFKRFYNVGPDELDANKQDLPDKAKWAVAWYEAVDYDGNGLAVAKVGRHYFSININHCSCYGPLEDPDWSDVGDYQAILHFLEFDEYVKGRRRDSKDCDAEQYSEILKKVKQLHKQERRTVERRLARAAKNGQ